MSLTTACGRNSSSSGSSARAASAACWPVGRVRVGGREHPVFLGGGEAEPRALDRGPPLLPGLDHHLVAAPGQRPAQGDRREDVPGVAEGGDQDAQALIHAQGAARACRGPRRGA